MQVTNEVGDGGRGGAAVASNHLQMIANEQRKKASQRLPDLFHCFSLSASQRVLYTPAGVSYS